MADRERLRRIPAVGKLLEHPRVRAASLPRWAMADAARLMIDEARIAARSGAELPDEDGLVSAILVKAEALARPSLRRVVNATGVVVHTNLGRAPLSRRALDAVLEIGASYTNLEYDLLSGQRGSRHVHASASLARLTGAEAAMVVNNGAAAVLLCLSALAAGREVVVSRGELVEIGGSFRIPDILRAGGARLVEVGTTNRTRLADYEAAITEETALLLKVHPSNFRMVGFTQSVTRRDLVRLGRSLGIPTMEDLGSGRMSGASAGVGQEEPEVSAVVAAGVDLVTFSGDKLLGGPQAGIICGAASLVSKLQAHPLARALRVGKLTLAALEATLASYLDGEADQIPVVDALGRTSGTLKDAATALLAAIGEAVPDLGERCLAMVEGTSSRAGGGSMPEIPLETFAVSLAPRHMTVAALEERLRSGPVPVIVRIHEGKLLLDPRTLLPGEVPVVAAAVRAALDGAPQGGG